MAKDFYDAWQEGDGARLLRCWKFFLLYFKGDWRTKYALEAFKLITRTSATLTPRKALQLIWNRTCNSKGGNGKNIPLDLKNEYLNAIFKADLNTFHSNISEHSVQRSSCSIQLVQDTLEHFDHVTGIYKDSGRHTAANTSEDFKMVLKTLQTADVFTIRKGRKHAEMKVIHADPLFGVKLRINDLNRWFRQHRSAIAIEQDLQLNTL